MSGVYLSALAEELGVATDVGDVVPMTGELGDRLRDEGLRFVRLNAEGDSVIDLGIRTARTTLARAAADRPPGGDVVDLVVISSLNPPLASSSGVAVLLTEVGLNGTRGFSVGGGACGDAGMALTVVRAMQDLEAVERVLLVVANAYPDDDRLREVAWHVLGDAGASCLVTRQPVGEGFQLLAMADARMPVTVPPVDGSMRDKIDAIRRVVDDVCAQVSMTAADFPHFICNNYGLRTMRLYGAISRVRPSAVHEASMPMLGHCGATDPFLNLLGLLGTASLAAGERILLVTDGPLTCTAMVLEYVPAPTAPVAAPRGADDLLVP